MKKSVMQVFFAGKTRYLASAVFALLFSGTALAGSIHWEKLPDRERITLNLAENEPMTGPVGRVAPTGVLIPFGRVPAGVHIPLPPDGAQIIKGTKHLGQSLVLETQGPEFGFVVTKHTPRQIVIDFFHNVLGARWKPSSVATTSEVAPSMFVQPAVTPGHETVSVEADPQGVLLDSQQLADQVHEEHKAAAAAAVNAAKGVVTAAKKAFNAAQSSAAEGESAEKPEKKTEPKPAAKPEARAKAEPKASPQKGQQKDAPSKSDAQAPAAQQPKDPLGDVLKTVSGEGASGAASPAPASPAPMPNDGVAPDASAPENSIPPARPPQSVLNGSTPLPESATPPATSVLDMLGQEAEKAEPLPLPAITGLGTSSVSGVISRNGGQTAGAAPQPLPVSQEAAPQNLPQATPAAPQKVAPKTAEESAPPAPQPAAPTLPEAQVEPVSDAGVQPGRAQVVDGMASGEGMPLGDASLSPQGANPAPGIGMQSGPGIYSGVIAGLDGAPLGPAVPVTPAGPLPGPAVGPAVGAEVGAEPQDPVSPPAQESKATPEASVVPPAGDAPLAEGQGALAQAEPPVSDIPPVAEAAPATDTPPLPQAPEQPGLPEEVGQGAGQSAGQEAPPPPPVIYRDAEGNEIPPPPNPAELLPAIRNAMAANDFIKAGEIADILLALPELTKDQREEVFHLKAEALFAQHKDDLTTNYTDIADATVAAINFNATSPRNAGALLRLGYLNLKSNRIAEAEARFNMLRKQFPNDENVPLTYYYWGEYHFGRNEMQKAADEFQYILQQFSSSRYAREAALGLARSFYRLGYYDQAYDVVEYIGKRWENFYVDYPPFLNMMGDIAFRLNKLDEAIKNYWLYINLEPSGEETDIILTRIGDIYTMKRERSAAKTLYSACIDRFAGKDGALVAMMRLAEESVNDDPSIVGMFHLFDNPNKKSPVEVYRTIISKYPESALVPLAEVKLALWHLWQKEYIPALDIISDFLNIFPEHELAPKAREIAVQAFSLLATDCMKEQSYARMREVWDRFPIVREQIDQLSPDSRVALAMSMQRENRPNEALKVLEPFFLGHQAAGYSEMALQLALSIYLEYGQWTSVMEVARQVELWELTPEAEHQLDYAIALAAENLGDSDTATPLWKKLFEDNKLPPRQMTYATFFYARSAERLQDYETAYFVGQTAFSRLLELAEKSPNPADMGKIKSQLSSLIDVSEKTGRLKEALGFAERHLQYLAAEDPDRPGVMYRMARIYKKQGNEESWLKSLNDIVALGPETVYGRLAQSELNASTIAKDAARFSPTGDI